MTTTRNRQPAGRGLCADCGTDSALTAAGDVIVHGPRDLRCTGSGRPPKPPAPPLFVPAVGVTADTAAEPSAAVESASAPVRYREGDRVRSGEMLGTVEAVYAFTVDVAWDDGRTQNRGADSIERVGRPEAEPVAESMALASWAQTVAIVSAEVANEAPTDGQFVHTYTAGPAYTRLDEDDGEIDGGAVTPRAETSRRDVPAEFAEPSLLGMAQQSRIQQLEAEIDAMRTPSLVSGCEPQRRRIAVLEGQLDASREEVAALTRRLTDALAERDMLSREAAASAADARRSRDTLRGALDLIGRLGPA